MPRRKPLSAKSRPVPGMSDAAVAAKTGKTWAQWVRALNAAGAAKLSHREIAAYLHATLGVPGWWAQMVTVGYERLARGRKKGETATGYSVSASRTVGVAPSRLFGAWMSAAERKRWMRGEKLKISTATAPKSIRAAWGSSRVAIMFYPKGAAKTAVAVDHMKLASEREAAKMKSYWTKQLDALEEHLSR